MKLEFKIKNCCANENFVYQKTSFQKIVALIIAILNHLKKVEIHYGILVCIKFITLLLCDYTGC